MVELKGAAVERFTAGPKSDFRAALFFGRDEGLASERAAAAMTAAAGGERYERIDIDDASLKETPTRLFDEAMSQDLFGAPRVLKVTNPGDTAVKALKSFLHALDRGDLHGAAFLTVVAGDLRPASALRKAFAAASTAAAIPCYPDDKAALSRIASRLSADIGGSISQDAANLIAEKYGHHIGLAKSEMEKLLLHADGGEASISDVEALGWDAGGGGVDEVVNAVLDGDLAALESRLIAAKAQGLTSETVLRSLLRLALDLAFVQRAGRGVDGLRPRPFGARKLRLERVMRAIRPEAFQTLTLSLHDAEADGRLTGAPTTLIADRALRRAAAFFKKTRR